MLQLSGDLAGKIITQYDGKSAEIGSNLVYAPVQNFGSDGKNIPAREFLGIDSIAEKSILRAIKNKYKAMLS